MIGQLEVMIGATLAALASFAIMLFKAWRAGRADAERQAMADRLNSIRTADEIEQAVAGNDPAKNRKELGQWSRR